MEMTAATSPAEFAAAILAGVSEPGLVAIAHAPDPIEAAVAEVLAEADAIEYRPTGAQIVAAAALLLTT